MARNGVWCSDHGEFAFKDAGWEANEAAHVWFWLCPVCEAVIGVDPYRPPADVPFTSSQADAQTSKIALDGIGTPDTGVAGQEHGFLAGIHRT